MALVALGDPRAPGFAGLRAFNAPCLLCVGSALDEGHLGLRGVAPALPTTATAGLDWRLLDGVGIWVAGLCVWCMERLSTRVLTAGAPPMAVAMAAAASCEAEGS